MRWTNTDLSVPVVFGWKVVKGVALAQSLLNRIFYEMVREIKMQTASLIVIVIVMLNSIWNPFRSNGSFLASFFAFH